MRKVLPTHAPYVTTYPQHANLFSIIDLEERSLNWVFHNYLLLFIHFHENGGYGVDLCSHYAPWHKLRYASCPMIACRTYDLEVLSSKFTLNELIFKLIDNKNYIYFFRKIKQDKKHEVLISGYDSDIKKYLCHDFWDGIYQSRWVCFDEIELPLSVTNDMDWAADYLQGIWAIQKTNKYKIPDAFYYETTLQFNIEDLIDIFAEYLGYKNEVSNVLIKDGRKVGLEVYDIMVSMLRTQKINLKNRPFDIHAFHLLFEHKKLLALAIDTFVPDDVLRKKAALLMNKAEKLRNIVLYCNAHIRKDGTYKKYKSIEEEIMSLKMDEKDLLETIYRKYSNCI